EKPRAPSVSLKECPHRAVPQAGRAISAGGDYAPCRNPARREHSADVALELRDDPIALEIDPERGGYVTLVAREGDDASSAAPEGHDADGHLQVRQNRAARSIDAQPPCGIGHHHPAIWKEFRGINARRRLKCALSAVVARDEHGAVDGSAHHVSL